MKFILYLSSILLFSCNELNSEPENLIEKEKMVFILTDFYVYKQQRLVPNYQDSFINPEKIQKFILKKHKVSSKDFQNSFQYYFKKGEDIQDIYKSIQKEIQNKITINTIK